MADAERRCEICNRILNPDEGNVCDLIRSADSCTEAALAFWQARASALWSQLEWFKGELDRTKKFAHCSHGERRGNCLVMGCSHHYTRDD